MQERRESGPTGSSRALEPQVEAEAGAFSRLPRYLVAVLLGVLGLAASWVLYPTLGRSGLLLFFIVVVVSAWYGGLGPAIVSMVISVVAIVPLYAPPIGESGFAVEDALSIGTFLIVSLVIALVTASREKASRALAGSLAEERRSEARNLAVMDSVAEALVLISPEQRILTVNRRFEELFGVPAAQVLGRRFDKVGTIVDHVFADPAKLDKLVTGSIDDTEHFYTEIVVQNWPQPRELELFSTPVLTGSVLTGSVLTGSVLTGSVLTGSVGSGPVRTGSRGAGAHLGRLYVFRDITHEREVDRMKTEFVSLVSHELRTPLTSVKGFTDMILDGDAGDINEEVREFLEIVKSNADRLITLINDLLDISRIESGRIQLKIEPVDLAEIVQAAVAGMQPQIEAKGQSLDVNVDPEAAWVQGDRDKLLQVLTNCLSNAHKYTQAGGDIRIMVKRKRDFAHVTVVDNGYGIAWEDQEKVFSRFYRVDSSQTNQIGGTGLGLSIVKSVIELHGGWVGLESELGQGSTFFFTVPVAEGSTGPETANVGEREGKAQQLVLIVEHDANVRERLRAALDREGLAVSAVGDGEAGLAAARSERPRLILLSLSLPDIDGLAVLQALKQESATAAIPVIAMASNDAIQAGARPRALSFGAADVVAQPLDTEFLVEESRILMRRREQ